MKLDVRHLAAALAVGACCLASGAHAHGDAAHPAKSAPVVREQKEWGIAGDAKAVRRTVRIRMLDTMRFAPDKVSVKQGETIRFVIRNEGRMLHEFVIGTRAENDAHAALMIRFPDMEHDEPWMAHVPPGQAGEIVWHFNRAGEFDFACLIAGHYQAGMVGRISVSATQARNPS
ncbi:cupredoxin domain-containing protein [Rivibacter subsaxonicus]|uniref:Putative cupredoxin-like copper-binding protein n=1 Tax=Rivibacter subsaxonicus TaxID=457575 RepID=A0A4Q7W251_9BURK|nr:cupredoxin family protein [Rivibacter subsaxonicus]RZU03068.1 putative cupredoxin-like copper-binding protein [Rivibacter subsaxonicus]